ncbi:MAG: hypothetical protein ACO1OQ_04900 [Rufibacter sp.]
MFGLFKSGGRNLPEFKQLNESGLKDKYFFRVASWSWLDKETIYVLAPNQPKMVTMDAWPQLVFLEADGQKTIEEFTLQMAKQYKKVPEGLDDTILYQIHQLVDGELIKLADEAVEAEQQFIGPIN